MGCWKNSRPKKSKRWVAGKIARAKNQKDGRREIPEPEKSKRRASGNSASPNRVKMARREIPQGQIKLKRGVGKFRKPRKIKKTGVGKFRKIEKFYLRIDFLSWRQNVNRLTLQTKKIKTKFHD